MSCTKKKFKVFRKYPIGQNREGKVCVFKGFVFDYGQKRQIKPLKRRNK
jgi:hypothetical protein